MAPTIDEQIARGALVCPRTLRPLVREGAELRCWEGGAAYPVLGGVPVLLRDAGSAAAALAAGDAGMVREYEAHLRSPSRARLPIRQRLSLWLDARAARSRTPEVEAAFRQLFAGLGPGALCLSVGGGPVRVDPRLVNLNVGRFDNVDVVADAYGLPYASGSVDAVHCEAVLEHLELPDAAVAEMFRVLRSGARAYAATPFLQAYHGYPDHYQNFTLSGHRRLFERAGFVIESSGCAIGPVFALRDLAGQTLRHSSAALGRWLYGAWMLTTLPWLVLDRILAWREAGTRVASLTFLLARKP